MSQDGVPRVWVSAEGLREKEACMEGLAEFRSVLGDEIEMLWDREHQLFLVRTTLGRFLGWAWEEGILPKWSMKYTSFAGECLVGVDLTGADLQCCSFDKAILSGATMVQVNACEAGFVGACCRKVDFELATLRMASFIDADLREAFFRMADLKHADLGGADLRGANLRGANLRGADATDANFRDALWSELSFPPQGDAGEAPEFWEVVNGRLQRKRFE